MISLYDVQKDEVISSSVAIGKADYEYALESLLPLLDRFDEQRKSQAKSFYLRLKNDILKGCIMPPITLAFVSEKFAKIKDVKKIQTFVNDNISDGYVLDGMQRLNTLRDASDERGFDSGRPILLNVVIAERYDLLLYRMITLNNGQKPMTARHQIEMLTKGVIDISQTSLKIITEKETETSKPQGAFKKADIIEAYIAFLTNSVNNKNSKIIESKLDDILVGKVMDSNLSEETVEFSDVLKLIEKLSENASVKNWLRVSNNLIGFTVGVKKTLDIVQKTDIQLLEAFIERFDLAFPSINPSKVNVGKYRRELSRFYFERFNFFIDSDVPAIEAAFFEETLTE